MYNYDTFILKHLTPNNLIGTLNAIIFKNVFEAHLNFIFISLSTWFDYFYLLLLLLFMISLVFGGNLFLFKILIYLLLILLEYLLNIIMIKIEIFQYILY